MTTAATAAAPETDPTAPARDRLAAMRARVADDLAAAARFRAMTRDADADAWQASALAELERAAADGQVPDLAAVVDRAAAAYPGHRANLKRAAARDDDRARADAGQVVERENRTDRMARLAGQYHPAGAAIVRQVTTARADVERADRRPLAMDLADAVNGADLATLTMATLATPAPSATLTRAADLAAHRATGWRATALALAPMVAAAARADRLARHRAGRRLARARTLAGCYGADVDRLAAALAALAADGPVTRADHDPAGCTRVACQRCQRGQVGPLTRPAARTRPGQVRRPSGQYRAPSEVTRAAPADLGRGRKSSDGQTQVIRESDLLAMADRTRSMGASGAPGGRSIPPRAAIVGMRATALADLAARAIVPAPGQRGTAVAWVDLAAAAGWSGRVPMATIRVQVAAACLAAAGADHLADDLTRLARAAGVGAADLATAWQAFDDLAGPTPARLAWARLADHLAAHPGDRSALAALAG